MVEQCMSEYDLDGWTDPRWINPDDVRWAPAGGRA
jgi:4-hydroxyphenylacetate 3-monooxygenase